MSLNRQKSEGNWYINNHKYIVLFLKIEDKEHKKQKTVGECLEYFLKNKLFEDLVAYALTDKPSGFFKYAL